jgi:hypothetical protein
VRRAKVLAMLTAIASIVALALVPASQGQGTNVVRLAVGDYVRVFGQHGWNGIICYRAASAVPVQSIECYVAGKKGVRPSSYSGFVSACATSVFKYDSRGRNPERIFKRQNRCASPDSRSEGSSQASGREHDLHVGETAYVKGTAIHCTVSPDAAPVGSIECYVHDAKTRSGVKARTYSVLLSPSPLSIYRYGSASTTRPRRVYRRAEPTR